MKKIALFILPLLILTGCTGSDITDNSVNIPNSTAEILRQQNTNPTSSTPEIARATSAPQDIQIFPMSQVEPHNSLDDCWTSIEGKVYNLTSFASKHPGGSDAIESLCGKEGTENFLSQHGGDRKAIQMLASLYIGELSQ